MPFSNKRNSRDDKSGKSRRSTTNSSYNDGRKHRDHNTPAGENRSSAGKSTGYPRSEKPFKKFDSERPQGPSGDNYRKKEDKPFQKSDRPYRKDGDRPFSKDGERPFRKEGKPFAKDGSNKFRKDKQSRPYGDKTFGRDRKRSENPHTTAPKHFSKNPEDDGLIRLNRYIANSGVCSRRKADELIEAGVVSVNGNVITELGPKVDPAKDDIRYNGQRLRREKMIYVLPNKPKDYLTTTEDPQERRTVMLFVAKATSEQIYPVGKLDSNTTHLLLLTKNDHLA